MVLFYRHSIPATIISILGVACAAGGAMLLVMDGDLLGIVFLLIGFPAVVLARKINMKKEYALWWKEHVDSQREEEIRQSQEAAIAVYNENPQHQAILHISQLNPEAGAHIQERINQLKAQRGMR